MNLYFRLIWLFLWRMRKTSKIDFLGTSHICFRVLPLDCDINGHLTNARYSSFMDLARTYMLAEMGLLKRFLKLKWLPVVNAAEFTYIRDIKPFQQFEIQTKLLGWDEKYFYIEQRFVSERGTHAIANLRGVFICKGKKVTVDKLIEIADFRGNHPKLSETILQWKTFLQTKKDANI